MGVGLSNYQNVKENNFKCFVFNIWKINKDMIKKETNKSNFSAVDRFPITLQFYKKQSLIKFTIFFLLAFALLLCIYLKLFS